MSYKKDDPEMGDQGVEADDDDDARDDNNGDNDSKNNDESGLGIGPRGDWSTGLCDCFDVIVCQPICCMATCCNVILLAQVMTRLGLNWCGKPDPTAGASTFSIVIMSFLAYWAGYIIVFGILFTPCYIFWMINIFTRTRYETRQYFQIEPEFCQCCDGVLEDCLLGTFCSCCATIQQARHTHDEERYPYEFNTPDGLPEGSPPLAR